MRIDVRISHYPHTVVWHVTQCRQLKKVVWIDDETNRYALYIGTTNYNGDMPLATFQAKKIVIREDLLLVLIDPIDDALDDASELLLETADGPH